MPESPTLPTDRATAEEIITGFYRRIGRTRPSFLWFDDPLSCLLASALFARLNLDADGCGLWQPSFAPLRFRRPVGGLIRSDLWSTLERELQRELSTSLHTHVTRDQFQPEFLERFWSSFWSQVDGHVGPAFGQRLRRALRVGFGVGLDRPVRSIPAVHVEGFWGGAVDGAPTRSDGLGGPAVIRLRALQRACGWWVPRAHAVICSDRPQRIYVDAAGHLHAERGPALELSSQHRIYAWHGTRVRPEWIEKRDTLDPAIVLRVTELEQRRAGAEIIGWARLLERVPTQVIDADRDPRIGTLLECDLPGAGLSRFLRVRCATGREFVLSVPRTMTTALEANAWTYGLNGNDYQLEARS